MPTTVEELPAGFWDDEEASAAPPTAPRAAPPATADRRPTDAAEAPSPRPAPAPAPAPPPPVARPAGDPARPSGSPPALASLQGLALLQAVFPGRVVKVERTASPDDDAVPSEAVAAGPVDPPDDDLDPGADAPTPRTP